MVRRLLVLALVVTAVVGATSALSLAAKSPKPIVLVGKSGWNGGYAITLAKGGVDLAYGKLKHGRYTIYVHDYSDLHNFRLKGPGVNKWTTVPEIGTKVWRINLRKGVYTVVCDPHPVSMKFTFKVT
jgi:hypothetical protein